MVVDACVEPIADGGSTPPTSTSRLAISFVPKPDNQLGVSFGIKFEADKFIWQSGICLTDEFQLVLLGG